MEKWFFSIPFILVAVVTSIVWFTKNYKRIRKYLKWITLTDEAKEVIITIERDTQRLLPLMDERLVTIIYQQLPERLPECVAKGHRKRK